MLMVCVARYLKLYQAVEDRSSCLALYHEPEPSPAMLATSPERHMLKYICRFKSNIKLQLNIGCHIKNYLSIIYSGNAN